jgi:hypothetical protein
VYAVRIGFRAKRTDAARDIQYSFPYQVLQVEQKVSAILIISAAEQDNTIKLKAAFCLHLLNFSG